MVILAWHFKTTLIDMYIVHGRPRNSQSQDLIERANDILTDAFGTFLDLNIQFIQRCLSVLSRTHIFTF